MGFIRLDGTVVGNLHSAGYETNRFGKDVLKITGQFEGTNDTALECPAWLGDQLTDLGVMGQDQSGVWVDGSKRVAIWKTKENGQTRWGVGDGNGVQTAANFGQSRQRPQSSAPPQQQRPMMPRPPGASQPPPQQQRPTNGQSPQRSASVPQQPAEPADVTRRRIKATILFCLKEAAECWLNLGDAGKEVSPEAMQATAATIYLSYRDKQLPLLADPQAPPPMTAEQKAALKSFREICHRIGMTINGQVEADYLHAGGGVVPNPKIDGWFNAEVSKHGQLANLSADQAKKAIDAMAVLIANRENEIEKAKTGYTPSIDPPPPAIITEDTIPF